MTPNGKVNVEDILKGSRVYSRNEDSFVNKAQLVVGLLGRTADGYHRIQTEKGIIEATAEHPFWVQGKGWIEAKDIEWEDPIATIDGDVIAYQNDYIDTPTRVYNFTVGNTHNYFAGGLGAWVHNAGLDCFFATNNHADFLDYGLAQQGLKKLPKKYKEKWSDNKYNYELRAHDANPAHGKTGTIYRVSRKAIPEPGKQGGGTEYLDSSGVWLSFPRFHGQNN